ncbi:tRNA pseudouridine synthase-like 1 isoform X2 [Anoplophora glabripennis]|uniref:tRNA pseudouridine synthase-like 1 isoform X2 n=1 Tax=Anoplophora glabripennis TaxID=217634 RepID=UPI000874D3B4|nr:tRNA pseudouridine synthase-like 1 isoform X2 [Anoplophora glabripennis]
MSIYRYLLHIAYIGKPFRGAQRQVKGTFPRADDPLTVQGRLEMALKRLKPSNEPIVNMSSRTDSGVHAINGTCHVDLLRKNETVYEPRSITLCLNRYFKKQEVPIRIIKTHIVPQTFHSRHNAISRTYLYRMVIAKADSMNVAPNLHYIPIEEWDRCLFFCTNTFDLDRMKEAAKLLEGYHDFRTFMGKNSGSDEKCTRKVMDYIKVKTVDKTGYSNVYSWPSFIHNDVDDYLFVDVYLKSKSFLYRQGSV